MVYRIGTWGAGTGMTQTSWATCATSGMLRALQAANSSGSLATTALVARSGGRSSASAESIVTIGLVAPFKGRLEALVAQFLAPDVVGDGGLSERVELGR